MKTIKVQPQNTTMAEVRDDKTAKSLCKTYLFFIRVSGLFVGKQMWFQSKIHKYNTYLELSYTVISILFLIFYAVLFTSNFWRVEQLIGATFFRCIGFQMFLCAMVLISIMLSTRLSSLLPCFLNSLKTYEEQYGFCSYNVRLTRRLSKMKWILVFMMMAATILLNYSLKEKTSMSKSFYPVHGFTEFWGLFTIVLVFITHIIMTLQMSTCLIMYITLSYYTMAEFNEMSKQMEGRRKEDDRDLVTSIDFFYQKHEVMCQLLETGNKCLQPFLLLVFAVYIPLCCVILYAAILDEASLETVTITSVLIGSSMTAIFVVLLLGGAVNSKAHDMTGQLWKIKPATLSERGLQTLTLFTTKLCGQSIGFSMYGLFTINMPAILTIFGTILAYFIVIYQFKPSDPGACPFCNCTTTA